MLGDKARDARQLGRDEFGRTVFVLHRQRQRGNARGESFGLTLERVHAFAQFVDGGLTAHHGSLGLGVGSAKCFGVPRRGLRALQRLQQLLCHRAPVVGAGERIDGALTFAGDGVQRGLRRITSTTKCGHVEFGSRDERTHFVELGFGGLKHGSRLRGEFLGLLPGGLGCDGRGGQ